jgi:integrase
VAPLPFDETIGDLLAAFRLQGMASAHSDRTIDAREATITRLSHTVDVLTVDEDGLVEWLAGLDIKRSSKATYRAHVKAFFRWLAKTNRREDNPAGDLPTVRSPRGLPHPVASSDVRAILDACADPRARTTRAYVLLAAFAGLRVSEIARVRGEDFRDGQVFLTSKGEVASSVPLHPLLVELVATMPRVGWWFPSTTEAGHVDRVSVSLAIGRAMKRAGVFGVPHGLRHHFGTQVLRSTHGDLRTTQRLLRHASPATTAIYTQVADETSFRAVAGIPAA